MQSLENKYKARWRATTQYFSNRKHIIDDVTSFQGQGWEIDGAGGGRSLFDALKFTRLEEFCEHREQEECTEVHQTGECTGKAQTMVKIGGCDIANLRRFTTYKKDFTVGNNESQWEKWFTVRKERYKREDISGLVHSPIFSSSYSIFLFLFFSS